MLSQSEKQDITLSTIPITCYHVVSPGFNFYNLRGFGRVSSRILVRSKIRFLKTFSFMIEMYRIE